MTFSVCSTSETEAPPKAEAETQEDTSAQDVGEDALYNSADEQAPNEDSEELTEEELAGYGVDKQKRKSAFWSQAALRILTDRKPAEAFMTDDDEDSDSDL